MDVGWWVTEARCLGALDGLSFLDDLEGEMRKCSLVASPMPSSTSSYDSPDKTI